MPRVVEWLRCRRDDRRCTGSSGFSLSVCDTKAHTECWLNTGSVFSVQRGHTMQAKVAQESECKTRKRPNDGKSQSSKAEWLRSRLFPFAILLMRLGRLLLFKNHTSIRVQIKHRRHLQRSAARSAALLSVCFVRLKTPAVVFRSVM